MEKNYVVYQHVTPDGLYYFGQTNNIKRRWGGNGRYYKKTSLQPYIEKYGWENIQHIVLFRDQTKEDALWIEDFLITTAQEDGVCINQRRSGYVSKEEGYRQQCYQQNRQKILEQSKQYYETNKGQVQERHKQYYETNKGQILEQKKQYYQKNKDEILEYNREYQQKNREKLNKYHREYYEKNREKYREYHREYKRQYRQRKKLEKQLKEVETTPLF